MLSIFRHGTGQSMTGSSSQVIAANHSPTDSDPASGKTSSSFPPSECRSSGSSSPTHSLESPLQHAATVVTMANSELPEDLSLPRRTSSSSASPTSSLNDFVKCSQCLSEFANESLLQLHVVTRHSLTIGGGGGAQDDDQSVRCQYCGVLLLDPNYLQKHMEDAHGHQQPFQSSKVVHDSIKCPECNQSFPNELMLRGHLFDSHMSFSGPPMSFSEFGQKSSPPTVDGSSFSTNVFCSLCKRNFANEVELWTHMRFQHLHDTAAVNTLLNLQTQQQSGGNGSDVKGEHLNNDNSPTKFGENINVGNQQNKIFNLEAYCELCDKEFCNKYFLKTHKANKHGVFCDDLSPASMVMAQKGGPLCELSNSVTTPPLTNSVTTSTPIDSLAFLKNVPTSANATSSMGLTDQMPSTSPNQTSMNLAPNFSSSSDLFCPLCRQFFPNPLFLQSHMITAHGGGVHFGSNFNPNAMYAMMGAAAVNPFLQQMKFLNPHMAAAMFGMIPPPVPGSPQLHLASVTQPQSTPTSVLEYHLAANSGQNGSRKLDFGGNNGAGVASTMSNSHHHKDAFCELCQKEFCNKYFLKTHKLNKHGIFDDSFGDSPMKKMKSSPDMYQANEALGLEAGEISKDRPLLDGSFNAAEHPKVSPLSEALNKPPVSSFKVELNEGHQPSSKIAKLDLNGNGNTNGSQTPDAHQQQQVSCTLCMKSFPSLFALVAHKYRDHGSFDGNINALAAAMNVGGQSSPILAQMKMDSSPQRVSNGSAGATSAVPSTVDPDAYCEICKKEFCSKYFLRTHKLNIHGIVMECSPTQTTNGHGVINSMSKNDTAPRTPRPFVTGKNFCDICNKELCNKYFLRTHMLKMHGIVIDENKTVIGNINSLDKDMHHNLLSLFRCDICNKELGTRQQLKIHKQSVHFITSSSPPNNGGTPCSDVSNKLNGTKDMSHMPPNVTISMALGSKCSSTEMMHDQTSTNHDQLIDHDDTLNNHDQYSEFFDVCTLCNQRFKNAKWLRAHMITDHDSLQWQDTFLQPANNDNEQNQSLPCEYCSVEFADQVELQMHVIDVHQREVQGKATSLAEQAALDNIGAFANQQTDTPVSDAEPCDLSSVGDNSGKVYHNEQNISATVDEIASGISSSQALSSQDQNRRLQDQADLPMVARNTNGTKMYKCSYCNYYTRWISNLSTHEKRHNATHQLNGCDRPFVCRVCLRAYRYAHSLQRHMEVHRLSSYGMQMQMNSSVLNGTSSTVGQTLPSEKATTSSSNGNSAKDLLPMEPYDVSPRKTLSDDNSVKQYQCNLCEKSFRNKELYRMHLLSIHKTSPPKENVRRQNGTYLSPSTSSALSNGFASSSNANSMVSPKKVYRCRICNVGARVYQELCQHLIEAHGITPKQKSSNVSPQKICHNLPASDIQGISTATNSIDDDCNQIENHHYSESVPKTPEPKNGRGKQPYPISHGTPQRLSTTKTPTPAQPFVMQPFLMKESVDSGIFVPSVVYLPITKEVDGVMEAKFTFYPIRTSDLGNVDPNDVKRNDQPQPSLF